MSASPPEVVEAVRSALDEFYDEAPAEHVADMADAVLDAVTAATPTLRHHDDGRLSLEWVDEPAVGALVVVKADVLRRLVDKVNEGLVK